MCGTRVGMQWHTDGPAGVRVLIKKSNAGCVRSVDLRLSWRSQSLEPRRPLGLCYDDSQAGWMLGGPGGGLCSAAGDHFLPRGRKVASGLIGDDM